MKNQIEQALRDVIEPDLGENIVDLGLVRSVDVGLQGETQIDIAMTTPHSRYVETVAGAVRHAALRAGAPRVVVRWVTEPAWTPYDMVEPLRALLGLPDDEPQAPPAALATSWRGRVRRRLTRL